MLRSRSARARAEAHRAAREGRSLAVGRALAGGAAAFVLSGAALTAVTGVMARVPLVPEHRSKRDAVVRAAFADRLHLDATPETTRPGVLALRQDVDQVHVRLGDVASRPTPTTVSRPILAVDTPAPPHIGEASTNGFFWAGDPMSAHGIPYEDVVVDSRVGPMPAWLVRPEPGRTAQAQRIGEDAGGADPGAEPARGTWAVLVHGHGSTRGEALRLIPLLRRLGITTLTITYRNDMGASPSIDRMHHLGAGEWEDAESAIGCALTRGAERVVLVGWSMGGGIALRTSVLSEHRDRIAALILDSPAIDWQQILDYHASQMGAPRIIRKFAPWMMRSPLGARLVRLHEPIALAQMHPSFYAEHLAHPTLLLHAGQDATVPPAPSADLAQARPDLVEYVPWPVATHTREWNVDPALYEEQIAGFLSRIVGVDAPTAGPLPVRDPAAAPQRSSTGARL